MTEINYTAADEAVRYIKTGDRVFIHGNAATPVHLARAMQKRYTELYDTGRSVTSFITGTSAVSTIPERSAKL